MLKDVVKRQHREQAKFIQYRMTNQIKHSEEIYA